MRNLHILTKSQTLLEEIGQDDTITAVCIDEYGHLLFVYTMNHHLYIFKLDSMDLNSVSFVSKYTFK